MHIELTDVLVVGAGPTGLAASALLARQGVEAVTLSRHPGTAPQPRATITNQRTVEVYRDLGIEHRVSDVGVPLRELGNNVLATSLTGREIFRYPSFGTGSRLTDYARSSPCANYNAPQHLLEPVILEAAREFGADIRFSNELLQVTHDEDKVVAVVLDRDSGQEYAIEAKYLIGADGARSRVAEQTGFKFAGEAALAHMLNLWVEVDLTEHAAYRPSVLYTILQPGGESWVGSGAFTCIRPFTEWVVLKQYDPAQGEPDVSDTAVTAFVRGLIGDPQAGIRLKGTSKWQVNHLVATEFRRGRIFLAGDAAHRHPPAGGLGSNTSVQDAFNLAWKLSLVLSGHAGDRLLDSYHEERHPVGAQVVERTIINLQNQAAAVNALGLRQGQSPEEGWRKLNLLCTDEEGAAEARAELANAVSLQHYRSNAHGIDLGQRYTSCVITDDGTPFPTPERDPALYYHPTTHPGGYLPHAWLEHRRQRISTLDLAGHDQFCLIIGIGGAQWADAAKKIADELQLPLPVFAVGYRCDYDDVLSEWSELCEIDDRGALLVRPDRHIAWRSSTRPSGDAAAELGEAVRRALGRAS